MTTSDEMGAFCHDNYEAPLLWCDEKKRLVERKNAEESLRMWRRRKAEEMARKDREKEEYYDLFLRHCPWGRPGGGAPNVDVRRKDITAVGLHSTPTIATTHRLTAVQPRRYADYFSKHKKCHDPLSAYHHHIGHVHHHHVPRSTTTHKHTVHHIGETPPASVTICEREVVANTKACPPKNGETIQVTLKNHPSMSFRNKAHLDIEVRYKPTAPGKGRPLLEKIVVTESEKCPYVEGKAVVKSPRRKKITAKLEKPLVKDPWGKPGPGGKPWRSPKAVGSTFMKSLGWTNKEMLKELDQDNPATPAEKPTFRKLPRYNKKLQRCCDRCTCTCPAMASGGGCNPLKAQQRKSQPSTLKGQVKAKVDSIRQKVCPRLTRCGDPPPTTGTEQTGLTTPAGGGRAFGVGGMAGVTVNGGDAPAGGGGVELVPLLARRRAANRPISLSSTDVTKRSGSNERLGTPASLSYLHELNTQVSQRRRLETESLQHERELCNQHFETFDTYWGRPGHGAPMPHIKNKLKLDKLLYGNFCHSE